MKNPGMLAKKVARGINYQYGMHLVINVSEFYTEGDKLVRMYVIRDAYSQGGGYVNQEIYKSGSGYNVLFFMVDLLHRIKHEELIDNNERWVADRERKNAVAMMDYLIDHYIEEAIDAE